MNDLSLVVTDLVRLEREGSDRESIPPGAIGITFVPRPSNSVVSGAVGDEMVLVDAQRGTVHSLNAAAALVWQFFDGRSPLADLVDDLSEGFGLSREVVRSDVLEMTRAAGRAGLLDGVADTSKIASTGPAGLAVGDSVPLPPTSRGENLRSLLVNWSGTCGFCVRILPQLVALQPRLEQSQIEIVLLDEHDPGGTRKLLGDNALKVRVLGDVTRNTDLGGPFNGMGTPAAYLLDADGTVRSTLAYGAEEVVALAGSAGGRAPGGELSRARNESPRFLPMAGGACGPTRPPAGTGKWQPAGAYRIGSYWVGIRGNSAFADRALATALAEYRLPPEVRASDDFSIVLAHDPSAGRRDLNLLLAGTRVVARSRSSRRVLRALASHLSCLLEPEPGLTRLDAVGALVDGQGVLLPKALIPWLSRVQAPLAQLGVAVVDDPYAQIDSDSGELVVVEPRIRFAEGYLEGLIEPEVDVLSEPAAVPIGRYPLRTWVLPGSEGRGGKLTPAGAVAAALGMLVAEPEQVAGAIDSFVGLVAGMETVAVRCEDPSNLVEDLRAWRREEIKSEEHQLLHM